MKLADIRSHSVPVEIVLDETTKITLRVFTRKGTIAQQREFAKLIESQMMKLEDSRKQAGKLDKTRDALLRPVELITDEIASLQASLDAAAPVERAALRDQIAALETQRDEKLNELEKELKKLNEQAGKLIENGQRSLEGALAEKLAFYVKDHDITDSDEKPLPATAEFFAENFDFALMERASDAIDGALSSPLATSSGDKS